jgi:hypothetical protein
MKGKNFCIDCLKKGIRTEIKPKAVRCLESNRPRKDKRKKHLRHAKQCGGLPFNDERRTPNKNREVFRELKFKLDFTKSERKSEKK